jgi:hypothetical protein
MANPSSHARQSTVAPRLVRAVSEATQPFGAFLQGPPLHVLEASYLWLIRDCSSAMVLATRIQRIEEGNITAAARVGSF